MTKIIKKINLVHWAILCNFVTEKIDNMSANNDENLKLEMVDKFVRYTNANVFLTGKAGTGKTTFLRNLARDTYKRLVIVAPTGVAAINAGGVTIHSFFQLPFGPQIPEDAAAGMTMNGNNAQVRAHSAKYQKVTGVKLKIIRSLDLLVIDEISMVRADLLDAVDAVLRRVRRNSKPFGGVQVLMIGDIHQLAPVAKSDEWELLEPYYKSVYFFDSHVLQKTPYYTIELDKVYRQSDEDFISILNKVRNNCLDNESLTILNSRFKPDFEPDDNDGFITLMTHNRQVDEVNETKLNMLKDKSIRFVAKITGTFPEVSYPTKADLELKVGAQVMFVKNDPSREHLYYNGKIGKILSYDKDDGLYVKCDDEVIKVEPVTWQNFEYSINSETKEIEEKDVGSFTQIPLKTAWAITIHKSQGLTFKKVIIDASLAFAHGQVYVALSRCTSLDGLVLKSRISQNGLFNDLKINQFIDAMPEMGPNEEQFEYNKVQYEMEMLFELFSFRDIESDISKIIGIVYKNKGIFEPTVVSELPKLEEFFHKNVTSVSDRFQSQITRILHDNFQITNNLQLQERIAKGSVYFLSNIETVAPILEMPFQTDNATVNGQLKETLDLLRGSLLIKKSCLEICNKGFNLERYLETKNRKIVEAEELVKKTTTSLKRKQFYGDDLRLYKALVSWREDVAFSLEIQESKVIPTKTLQAIVEEKPTTIKELKALSKVGSTRIQRYGKEILNIVLEHQGMARLDFDDEESKMELTLTDTVLVTKGLLDEGFTPDEIADHRGMAVTTIQGHISDLILKGCYSSAKYFMSQEHYDTIVEYFVETQDASLGAAHDVLGRDYTYGELRMVLSELRRLDVLKI